MAHKYRADELIYKMGLSSSREQAKRLIMAGLVLVNDKNNQLVKLDKAGHQFTEGTYFELVEKSPYVSRGAYKLLTALEYFKLEVQKYVCLDAGASTGGFTDLLLQRGASKVYAVDVGHDQLHEKLKNDERVINLERNNIRNAELELIPEQVDLIVADLSFISLTLILPSCVRWLKTSAYIIALVKPQFELGPHQTEKGVVKDEVLQLEAVEKVKIFCTQNLDLDYIGMIPSAIKGPKGNQEYLVLWRNK